MNERINYHNLREGGGKPHSCIARHIRFLACFAFFFLSFITPSIVSAQDADQQSKKTKIIADDEAGTVSIVIDGKTVGMFTKDGLYVMGDIYYGGTITDTGSDFIKNTIEENNNRGGANDENQ